MRTPHKDPVEQRHDDRGQHRDVRLDGDSPPEVVVADIAEPDRVLLGDQCPESDPLPVRCAQAESQPGLQTPNRYRRDLGR